MRRKKKKILSIFLCMSIMIGTINPGNKEVLAEGIDTILSNPEKVRVSKESDKTITTWDCIWLGNYWQNDTNGDGVANTDDEKEPIKWRVLQVYQEKAFVVADKILDIMQYNKVAGDMSWEGCTLRSWLNGYGPNKNEVGIDYSDDNFLDLAFSDAEQTSIKTTYVPNQRESMLCGGNDTRDKIFLMSFNQMLTGRYGFFTEAEYDDETRTALSTLYVACGGREGKPHAIDDPYGSNWWTRSPGIVFDEVSYIATRGYVSIWGINVEYVCGVRPAMNIDLSSDQWTYAGIIKSDGTVDEKYVKAESPTTVEEPVSTTAANVEAPTTVEEPVSTTAANVEAPTTVEEPVSTTTANVEPPTTVEEPVSTTAANVEPPTTVEEPVSTTAANVEPPTTVEEPVSTTAANVEPPTTVEEPSTTTNTTTVVVEQTTASKPNATSIKKITAKKRALRLKWRKVSGIGGYIIKYSTNCNFKKAKKVTTVKIKKSIITSMTLKGLKKKKLYFVKIRTYRKVNGKIYYSEWSDIKWKKTK
ncbi:MAG: DUF6273 domain-containing protein [Lachnospiraceae bacterium]|nr:DUF6273 domain-containing protein [Lachnospiraceae bacterium]